MYVLVTGGAGYVGSIVTNELISEGHSVITFDNLTKGYRQAVNPMARLVEGDLTDRDKLEQLFRNYQIEVVIHLAGESVVADSVIAPNRFFSSNVLCGINLIDAMIKNRVLRLVFSSTAAVYGSPRKCPIKESAPKRPINPYGESKLMFENILYWYGRAYGLKFVALRYFNAAGASENYGEDHVPETHLIPNVLKVALGQKTRVPVFGTDYPTRDGTCIRDYVHVLDIAKAHILPLEHSDRLFANKAYNLGSGEGTSVFEVIETAKRITGTEIPLEVLPKRQGDPPVLVASSDLARNELGWHPEFSELETIIASAWQWHKKHPNGYKAI